MPCRAEPTPTSGLPVQLSVNFDAELDKLLREVHDFLLMPSLSVAIPEPALALYERSELFRQQISALGLLAEMHNTISSSIIPVESALLQQQLADVQTCLRHGVEVRRGHAWGSRVERCTVPMIQQALPCPLSVRRRGLTAPASPALQSVAWNSGGLDTYLAEAGQLVRELDGLLSCIKGTVTQSQGILQQWQRDVMFERKEGRVAGFEELGSSMRDLIASRHAAVPEGLGRGVTL